MSVLTPLQIVKDLRLVRTMAYSGYALLVWDYLLTLDDEVTYIWKSPPSVVKYLFIANRYANLLVQAFSISQLSGGLSLYSDSACLALGWALALTQFWSYTSVHVLVLLRIWIVYGRTREITITLAAVLFLYSGASFALLAYILFQLNFNPHAISSGKCGGELAPLSWLIWVVELVFETCLLGLMIFTLRRQKQKSTSVFSPMSRLIRSLHIHAVIFFLANSLSDTVNIIAWNVFVQTPLYYVTTSLTIALVNITGQRLAIDLRRLHIHKDVTQSAVSREVECQLAAFGDNAVVS